MHQRLIASAVHQGATRAPRDLSLVHSAQLALFHLQQTPRLAPFADLAPISLKTVPLAVSIAQLERAQSLPALLLVRSAKAVFRAAPLERSHVALELQRLWLIASHSSAPLLFF